MPAATAPTGYSRRQIALHRVAFALMEQDLLQGAMSVASNLITEG